ncbi:MAG: response regulator [Devosiaceae bacterium]
MKTYLDLSSLSLLVADDSRFMRRLVVSILRAFGVRQIEEVATGEEAYKAIGTGKFDIVLLDWEFPDRSGESVMRAIRKPGHPSAYQTVIMMSGHDELRRIERALSFGVNGYLAKPVAPATLYAQIRQTVLYPRPYLRTPHYFGPHYPSMSKEVPKAEAPPAEKAPPATVVPTKADDAAIFDLDDAALFE